jgi:hypothetical protein
MINTEPDLKGFDVSIASIPKPPAPPPKPPPRPKPQPPPPGQLFRSLVYTLHRSETPMQPLMRSTIADTPPETRRESYNDSKGPSRWGRLQEREMPG